MLMATEESGRFITKWYVTTTEKEATRLAEIDHTPIGDIEKTPGVKPTCVNGWSYWSDEIFISKSFAGDKPNEADCPIVKSAQSIISRSNGSDSGFPSSGILHSLVTARSVKEIKDEYIGDGKRITEYEVDTGSAKKEKLFAASAGGGDGYMFEVERTRKAAQDRLKW